eukprot:14383880-Alexandrium_andersonii.AAC.1
MGTTVLLLPRTYKGVSSSMRVTTLTADTWRRRSETQLACSESKASATLSFARAFDFLRYPVDSCALKSFL